MRAHVSIGHPVPRVLSHPTDERENPNRQPQRKIRGPGARDQAAFGPLCDSVGRWRGSAVHNGGRDENETLCPSPLVRPLLRRLRQRSIRAASPTAIGVTTTRLATPRCASRTTRARTTGYPPLTPP